MRIAIISDIHGNIENYNRFCNYIKDKDINTILNLGDFIGGENLDDIINLLRSDSRIISILGNHDENLIAISNEFKLNISRHNLVWLKNLGKTKVIELNGKKLLIMHSTRDSTTKNPPIYEGKTLEGYLEEFNDSFDFICFGHTHVQLYYQSFYGKHLINPGSLGLARDIKAEFCILTIDENINKIDMISL